MLDLRVAGYRVCSNLMEVGLRYYRGGRMAVVLRGLLGLDYEFWSFPNIF